MSRAGVIFYVFFILSLGAVMPVAYGQLPADTLELSKAGKNAKSDELYFDAVKAKMHDDDTLAANLFEQFAALRPDVSDAYYELAKISYGNKRIDKAEEYIKKAIGISPDNKWYQEEYASILADRGDFAEAAKIMGDIAKSEPDDPDYSETAAEYYEHAQKYAEALSFLDKAITIDGEDEELMMHKVEIYLKMNDVEKAAGVIKELITNEPRNGRYYKLLGDLYDNNKMPEKAAGVYDNANKLLPEDPFVESGLAEHYLNLHDTASYIIYAKKAILNNALDAETQMDMLTAYFQSLPNNDSSLRLQGMPVVRQLLAEHPDDAQVLALYAGCQELNNQHDSAVWAYKKSLQVKPNDFNVWEKFLNNYTGKQDADSLIKYSEKFIRLFPNLYIAHYFNGVGHFNKNEYPAAIKAINRAIDMQQENDKGRLSSLYAFLGEIYHTSKQDDLSDKAFDKALELDPDNASVLNNYSYFLSVRGVKLEEAERMSKKSLALQPGEATYLDTYGWILYKKGDYEKAKVFIQRAIELSGSRVDGTLYDHLGNVAYKLNEKDKAMEDWKIAKEKGCDDPQIDKKISEGKLYE